MTPREEAVLNAPEAVRWVGSAIGALNIIIGFNGKRSEIENLPQFKAQQTHFHVELGPPPSVLSQLISMLPFVGEAEPALALLMEIRFRYVDIARVLSNPSIFVEAPAGGGDEQVGNAPAFTPAIRNGTIGITPYYQDIGPLAKVHCLVHEGAHFLSTAFQDFAYRDRKGEKDQNKYKTLGVQFAIRNADSYANFAIQMAKGIDRVIRGQD